MIRAKLIQDGDHQTIVLPPSIHLQGEEVTVEQNGSGILTISALRERTPEEWRALFRALDEAGVPDDFLADRGQEPSQDRPDF